MSGLPCDYVCELARGSSREQTASMADLRRTLAAYHLDKLAKAGLLSTGYPHPQGRQGRCAGRPAKLYTRTREHRTPTRAS